jgi:dimeric dUTPase (all-alpha-NTP-PPase superfamily)
MDKLYLMLELQSSLNDSTNGSEWEKGVSKNKKVIDWYRCIYMEACELIESYPWKHWKSIDAKIDRENIKIETVDIWHFILSQAIKEARLKKISLKTLAKEIESKSYFQAYLKNPKLEFEDFYQEIAVVEELIKISLCKMDLELLFEGFFEVAKVAKLSFDELYKLYVGKNILNNFRQNHGYKSGTYKKVWNQKEDNEVLQEILRQNPTITPAKLYEKLEEIYQKI